MCIFEDTVNDVTVIEIEIVKVPGDITDTGRAVLWKNCLTRSSFDTFVFRYPGGNLMTPIAVERRCNISVEEIEFGLLLMDPLEVVFSDVYPDPTSFESWFVFDGSGASIDAIRYVWITSGSPIKMVYRNPNLSDMAKQGTFLSGTLFGIGVTAIIGSIGGPIKEWVEPDEEARPR